ncbi:Bifunctional lycopene cyclase/phytoene synthase [Cytospora mali]|uniref:Bifunctional lycopene cyclase/phytoene synthase n=1 Tax=Cytospora mali TaxID=578113 RepID=A0A194UWL8_CYTMA|nr:Bifunctional lycopene cyclase/phytoene synthase [Valsa mali var. pyri (nom. inval.)]
MAYDYALVHLKFTITLAGVLTLISYPLLTRRHWYQTAILITIAVTATIPWDSYLIRHNVWTYPPDAIIGPTFCSIPAEEVFFFVIQTYNTSLLYQLLNKPLLHAEYLLSSSRIAVELHRLIQGVILVLSLAGFWMVSNGGPGTYLGLILIWVCPFAFLTWTIGGLFMSTLPWTSTAIPIALPTLYLWIVDEMALQRGTWAIESGTKLGATVWGSLEVEEAVFFLATNVLIVFGLGAFDNALAIVDAFPDAFESAPECPSPMMLIQALIMTWSEERKRRIRGIQEAVVRLCRKSRSFYLASSTFAGRLRIDLVLLYSYCRMADDLVDEPPEGLDTATWIARLSGHLDLVYRPKKDTTLPTQTDMLRVYINSEFPASARSALNLLPTSLLPPEPLYLLLEGFKTDSKFQPTGEDSHFPIADEECLREYASQVAGTVGELCLSLITHHSSVRLDPAHSEEVAAAARRMGIALQYVNIARDIAVDSVLGRVYLPTMWLADAGLTPAELIEAITKAPVSKAAHDDREEKLRKIETLRRRLLDKAFAIYHESRPAMDWLPDESRRPMIVAVESYMEIGRVLMENEGPSFRVVMGRPTRATVPKSRRLRVALRALLDA